MTGSGNDTVNGSTKEDVISGGSGDDIIHGHQGDDYLEGGEGSDIINGGAGKIPLPLKGIESATSSKRLTSAYEVRNTNPNSAEYDDKDTLINIGKIRFSDAEVDLAINREIPPNAIFLSNTQFNEETHGGTSISRITSRDDNQDQLFRDLRE